MACRDCSPYTICFAIDFAPVALRLLLPLLLRRLRAFDDGQHFVFAHDEVFLAIELDLLAGVLAEEDEVAGLDVERDALAVVLRPCRCRRR